MSVRVLKIGAVDIRVSRGYEKQGFVVTDITGLSDYGEHTNGTPGSGEVAITGIILPGVDPVMLRAFLYSSISPHEQLRLEVQYTDGTHSIQTAAKLKSIKTDMMTYPATITITVLRYGGWFGEALIKQLEVNKVNDIINKKDGPACFDFAAPTVIEIQLLSRFSITDLDQSHIKVVFGGVSSIEADLKNVVGVIEGFSTGLNEGTVIRIDNSLEYHATLVFAGLIYDLPVLGKVVDGRIPPSAQTIVSLEVDTPAYCSIGAVLQTRETRLTV